MLNLARWPLSCLFAFWLALAAPLAWAKPVPWEITADSLIRYQEPESIFAEGNVVVKRPAAAGGRLTLQADWVRYDVERGTIKARGHVVIHSEDEDITAEAARMNLTSQTGVLEDATIFIKDNQLYLKGSEVEKTGEFTYTIRDGWASACRPEGGRRPAWSIRSRKARLTVDGMARLSHATFQIKEVPVLYSPIMVFPAKTKRETGFLFPEWSQSSRDGFGLDLPFFLNLSPSADLTLYPNYLAKRGLMAGIEFRYALAEDSRGVFLFSSLRDRLDDTDLDEYRNDKLIRRTDNRYWLRGKADHDFGEGLVAHLDLDFVSDQDFLQEFNSGSLGYEKNNLDFKKVFGRDLQEETLTDRESTAQLIKSWPDMVLSGEIKLIQNVKNDLSLLASANRDGILEPGETVYLSRTTSPLQSLPRIEFTGRTPLAAWPVSVAWDSEYVNYWRDRGVGAHRLDLHPQLIASLPKGGWVEGKLTGGIRETLYQVETYGNATWSPSRFQDRTAFDFEGNVATLLMRDFSLPFASLQWLEHTVRPNLIYTYLTRTQQKDLPSLDGEDRLTIKNWLTYEWNNYFDMGGTDAAGAFWNRNLGYVKIRQTYDVREARRSLAGSGDRRRELSDIRFDAYLYPLEQLAVRWQNNLSVYGQGITRYELQAEYGSSRGDALSVNYRFLRYQNMADPYFYTVSGPTQRDIETRAQLRLTNTVSLRGYLNKSFSEHHTVESSVGFVYRPSCWMMEADFSRTASEQRVMVIFSLDGIGRAFRWGKENV